MALVICCMFLTLRMRRRMSIRLGMLTSAFAAAGLGARRETLLELLDQRFDLLFRSSFDSSFFSRIACRARRDARSPRS